MSYMRTVKVNIPEKHLLYGYAQQLTALANNLSNAARFRQRQLMTAAKKEPADWTLNEQEVMDELYAAFPEEFGDGPVDRQGFLNVYGNLEKLMRRSENPDYFAEGFPRQCSQQVLKQAARDMKAFFESLKAYQKNPSPESRSSRDTSGKAGTAPLPSQTRTVRSLRGTGCGTLHSR